MALASPRSVSSCACAPLDARLSLRLRRASCPCVWAPALLPGVCRRAPAWSASHVRLARVSRASCVRLQNKWAQTMELCGAVQAALWACVSAWLRLKTRVFVRLASTLAFSVRLQRASSGVSRRASLRMVVRSVSTKKLWLELAIAIAPSAIGWSIGPVMEVPAVLGDWRHPRCPQSSDSAPEARILRPCVHARR